MGITEVNAHYASKLVFNTIPQVRLVHSTISEAVPVQPEASELQGVASPTFQDLRTPQALVQEGGPDAWYVAVHRKETQSLVFSGHSSPPEGSNIVHKIAGHV